jgi:hypothetical protein
MSYNNNGGNNNGSNPYNYIGSDAHVRSLENDARVSSHNADVDARARARRAFANGESEGYGRGWDDAVIEGNAVIALRKSEIVKLQEQNQLQANRIVALENQYMETVRECEDAIEKWESHSNKLKAMVLEQRATLEAAANETTTLKGLLTSLTEANQRLNHQITEQQSNHSSATTETAKKLALHERNHIFIHAITRALDDLLTDESGAIATLKKAFQDHYPDCVLEAQQASLIEHQLEHDAEFASNSPVIRQAILRLLDDTTADSLFDFGDANKEQLLGQESEPKPKPSEYPFPEH